MSAMTHTAISECSFPDSEVDTLDDSIERACSKLRIALKDVVLLRKQLRELVAMKKESAIEQVNKAKQHLKFIEKQESELSNLLGEDGTSSYFMSHHGEDDGAGSPLEGGKDLVDQRQNSQSDHQDIDLEILQVSLEGQSRDLDSMIAGGDIVSKGGTGDAVPAHKSGESDDSNPLSFFDDFTNLERLDDANLSEMITKNQKNKKILEKELKRREEARGLAILAKAKAELSALKAERESMRVRNEAIAVLEREILKQRERGLQLAPMAAPPPKAPPPKAPATKKNNGKVAKKGSGIICPPVGELPADPWGSPSIPCDDLANTYDFD